MTPPPNPEIALERAREALVEARDNTKLGHHRAAINRAYYATLYASLALLKSIGVDAKTHDGVHGLVAQHFVRAGSLDAGTSRMLKHLAADRDLADYDFSTTMSESDAAEAIADAAAYVEAVTRLLA